MSENNTSYGQIQIADEVIAVIAGTAALEVEGIEAAAGSASSTFADLLGIKNPPRGVKINVEDGEVSVELDVTIKFGTKIKDVAEAVQKKVKNAIETMTGLEVCVVNINVTAVTEVTAKSDTTEE